jgi:light-regulated signal transduction histidine kinase (bacteriophytochrome)
MTGSIHWTPPAALPEIVVRALRHELGDLLQTVYATVALLQQRLPADFQQERGILADLRRRAELCKSLLDDTYDLVSPVTLWKETVAVRELAIEMRRTVGVHYPRVQIYLEGDADPTLVADPRRLSCAARWLLTNACEAANQAVHMTVGPGSQPGQVQWTFEHDGQPRELDESDRSTDSLASSALSRLGWMLAQKMAELHGGRVEAGQGNRGAQCFRMVLPSELTV